MFIYSLRSSLFILYYERFATLQELWKLAWLLKLQMVHQTYGRCGSCHLNRLRARDTEGEQVFDTGIVVFVFLSHCV